MVDLSNLEAGRPVNAVLAVRDNLGITPYKRGFSVTLVVGNATGQLPCKLWLGPEEDRVRALSEALEAGTVHRFQGRIQPYRGRLELHAEQAPRDVEPGEWRPVEMLPTVEGDVRTLGRRLAAGARSITDPHLAALTASFWEDSDWVEALLEAPASKGHHHARLGGLVEHLHTCMTLAEAMAGHHPTLDRDLLLTGLLLHGVGKLEELSWSTSIEITPEGRLIGPTPLTDGPIQQAMANIDGFPDELALQVRHLVLSAPAKIGYGAGVEPRTPEAVALAHVLALDAEVSRFNDAAAKMRSSGEAHGWSPELRRFVYAQAPMSQGEAQSPSTAESSEA